MERQPLVVADWKRVSAWRFWSPCSPSHRFFLLLTICCVAFAGHFIRSGMAAIEQLMLDDPAFPISNTFYGAINSVVALPNLLAPFVGGQWLDRYGPRCLVYFVLVMLAGHAVFAGAMAAHVPWLALAGRFIFGMGEGSVYVGVRASAAHWFATAEITCAMGVVVMMTNVARMLSKVTLAPVALAFGGYVAALWFSELVILGSLGAALVLVAATARLHRLKKRVRTSGATVDASLPWLAQYVAPRAKTSATPASDHALSWASLRSIKSLPFLFWLVLALQILYVQNFHWFQNISASYLYQVNGYSIVLSGAVASLSHVLVLLSPLLGLALDKTRAGRLVWVVASTFGGVVAFGWLLATTAAPVVPLLLISLCLAATPAVLVATLARTIPADRFGMAFGVLEVLEATATAAGNLGVGYLRDATGSFTADIALFFGVAWVTVGLSLALVWAEGRGEARCEERVSLVALVPVIESDESSSSSCSSSPARSGQRQ